MKMSNIKPGDWVSFKWDCFPFSMESTDVYHRPKDIRVIEVTVQCRVLDISKESGYLLVEHPEEGNAPIWIHACKVFDIS